MRSKKAVLNILASLAMQVVALICGFIIPKLIIKNYGSDVNGLISSITQFLAYITLLEAGIGPVIKAALYKPIAAKDKNTIQNILKAAEKFFRVIAGLFIIYIVILSVIYPNIVKEFEFAYTLSLIVIIAISTFAEYFFGMTYKLYLQAEQKTYITSIIQLLGYVFNVIAVVILVRLDASVHIVKLAGTLIFVLRPIIQNIYVKKKYNINLREADNTYKLEQKWDGLAQHIAAVIHSNTDVTILTLFAKITEVSVYAVYHLVVNGVKSLIQSFSGGIDAAFGDMLAKGEKDKLNKRFNAYEVFYFTIITIVYTCTMLLITPFIKVYTSGITDVNYVRHLFGYLMVIAEFLWAIRIPYSSLTLAAGHFKQTKKGAWIESITNIVISLILVNKYGIVGVAIGTGISMLIRTVEFVYHTQKYVLERDMLNSIKKIFVILLEVICIVLIVNILPKVEVVSYTTWILQALITFGVSAIITLGINALVYRKELKEILNIGKNILKKKTSKQ